METIADKEQGNGRIIRLWGRRKGDHEREKIEQLKCQYTARTDETYWSGDGGEKLKKKKKRRNQLKWGGVPLFPWPLRAGTCCAFERLNVRNLATSWHSTHVWESRTVCISKHKERRVGGWGRTGEIISCLAVRGGVGRGKLATSLQISCNPGSTVCLW